MLGGGQHQQNIVTLNQGPQCGGTHRAFVLCLTMGLTFLISLMDYTQNSIILINRL